MILPKAILPSVTAGVQSPGIGTRGLALQTLRGGGCGDRPGDMLATL